MLIETDEGVINTAHIVSAKPVSERSPGRWSVTLVDGSTRTVEVRTTAFIQACGAIVPAQPGYSVLSAILPGPDEEGIVYSEEVVLAFRVSHGGDHGAPMPVTVSGETQGSRRNLWTVREPNGHCYGPDGDHETLEEWRAYCDRQVKLERDEAKRPPA